MKHTFLVLAVAFLLTKPAISQNVGILTTTPLATLSVGSTSQFRVNSTGNLIRINNVQYSFPAALPTTPQYLRVDGTANGNLTWAPIAKVVIRIFAVSPNGTSDYFIDTASDYAGGDNTDPTIVLTRGFTYQFAVTGGHPFWISATPESGAFTAGITNNGANNGNGTLTFTVPMDAPSTLYYYCSAHPDTMNGTITIL